MKSTLSYKNFFPAFTWFLIITIATCLPGTDLPKAGWLAQIHVDKWVHMGMFVGLTFLCSYPFFRADLSMKKKAASLLWIAVSCSLWGLAIEFIQKYFVTGRSFDLFDWAADNLGVLVVFWYCHRRLLQQDASLDS